MKKMTVRLIDIAKKAGVSRQAVSAVINKSLGTAVVSEATRKKIISISDELGYRPNAGARAITRGTFNKIAAVVLQYGKRGTSYFPNNGYMDAAADELAEHGYSLVLEPLHLDVQNDSFIEPPSLFSEVSVDGVLALAVTGLVPAAVDREIAKIKAPTIWMNRNPSENPDATIFDEVAHGEKLARHLIELGHKRIGYIGWKSPHYSALQRYQGVMNVLEEAGLDTSSVIFTSEHKICMVEIAEQILNLQHGVTGLICYNRLAYDAVIHLAAYRGIKVPRDLSVCYFASVWEVPLSHYRTTVLKIPENEMAVQAVKRLLTTINGIRPSEPLPPLVGDIQKGWTTSCPGEDKAADMDYCEHELNICINKI